MTLSKNIAQKIVQEMMDVIPYNINVMDKSGIIIGSGDMRRIGDLHEGAKIAIDTQHINEVYSNEGGMKPGVNEPIIIDGKIIGVIGITGNPDEVRRFSKLVRATAVLLIEQEKANREVQDRRLNMQKFYQELAHRKVEYDDEFYQRAKSYGLDLTKKCQAILAEGDVNSKAFRALCEKHTHYSDLDSNKTVFFITGNQKSNELIKSLEESRDINKIGLGGEAKVAATSLENAELAIEIGTKIKPLEKTYTYKDLRFFIHLSYDNEETLAISLLDIDKSGNKLELIQTIQIYVEENGDMNSVANRLNIHRNTLNYRLEKINQITGKNPKVFLELFELLCGLIWR
ncbi:MAG: sugar diacid recognition domain-containing protein [Clostridiaceae bacterium]